ncbi:hypothetical protein GCM10009839_93320 [Catenulispora yoronensis]|uniref:DUF11 domain-containing protein n=1 Tax=Catenulispora yoronensis TaxID=450799 RepID=A0ABP5HA48_9ACTN
MHLTAHPAAVHLTAHPAAVHLTAHPAAVHPIAHAAPRAVPRPRPRAPLGSVLLDETFTGSSVPDPGFIPLNTACLTGASSSPPPGESTLGPCSLPEQTTPPVPTPGVVPGYLQLTDNANYHVGSVLYNRPLPGNGGLQVVFQQYQYGGNGADGIGFFLVDGATNLTMAGADGGSLGYAQRNLTPGVDGGYLGLGLDAYGNFVNDAEQRGLNCPADHQSPVPMASQVPDSVTLRGPGQGIDGYCFLASTIAPDASQPSGFRSTLPGSLRAAGTDPTPSERTVRITVSPDPLPMITAEIDFEDGNGYQPVFSHRMDTQAPPTYKFGFSSSTGGLIDTHLIRNVTVSSVNDLNHLNLVKTVVDPGVVVASSSDDMQTYRGRTYQAGDTVTYQFLVTNTGNTTLSNVAVHDPSVTNISCPRTTLGPAGSPTSSMVCTGTHVLTVDDCLNDTYTNTANADGLGPDDTVVPSNPSSAQVPVVKLTAHLLLNKTATPTAALPGDNVGYTLTVTNQSAFALTRARASDDLTAVLDDATYNGDVTASSGTAIVNGSTLTWVGPLDVGASATITYSVTVHGTQTGNAELRNGVTSTVPGAICAPPAASALPCVVVVPVTYPPPPTPSPTPTTTPVTPTSVPTTPRPTAPSTTPHGKLPSTGTYNVGVLVLLAAGCVACGTLLVAARRRAMAGRGRHM